MRTSHPARSTRPLHRLFSGLATLLSTIALLLAASAHAQGVRLFTDGSGVNYWDYSYGTATGTSAVEVVNGSKIPVEFGIRWRGTSGVRVRWTSQPGGDWLIGLATGGWAPFDATPLDSLVFWAYSPSSIPAADLPLMFLEDQNNTRTPRYSMSAANPGAICPHLPEPRRNLVTVTVEAGQLHPDRVALFPAGLAAANLMSEQNQPLIQLIPTVPQHAQL